MKHGDNAETLSAFEIITEIFADEKAAIDCLASWRWEKGHDCPHCGVIGESKPWKQRYGHWLCNACRKIHSVRVGTIFHDSKISLCKWFFVMYAHQTARKGVSALEISKLIGVTKQTAWFMLHRLREAYGTELDAVKKMIGAVEVDEVFLGGLEHNKHAKKKLHVGGGTGGKQAVIGLRERETGRVIMLPINDRTKKTLQGTITKLVQPGTKIYTDEAAGYKGVHHKGYEHEWVKHGKKNDAVREFVRGMAHTNGIESVWAVVKRGHRDTYHHWSVKHNWRYLNEFTFRLNEGNVKIDTIDRIKAIVVNSIGRRLTYKDMIAGKSQVAG